MIDDDDAGSVADGLIDGVHGEILLVGFSWSPL
jgi:hypothetical protein